MNLRGCVSLVTGGGRRLGAGVSKQLAASGSDIAIHYRQSRQEAEATASELAESGVRTSCFQADLSEATEIEKLLTEVEREFGAPMADSEEWTTRLKRHIDRRTAWSTAAIYRHLGFEPSAEAAPDGPGGTPRAILWHPGAK